MRKWLFRILVILLIAIFAFSAVKLLVIRHGYKVSEKVYNDAISMFTRPAATPTAAETAGGPDAPEEDGRPDRVPIEVDFKYLTEVNKDVVGWIYCPDTVINYPVVYGRDNVYYLERDYRHNPDPCGTIFTDADNDIGFVDSNVIMYGHHMQDMAMFATLKYWRNQDYFDKHPIMWLLTPEQDYRVDLFSAYVTAADSESFTVIHEPGPLLDSYLRRANGLSEVHTEVQLEPEGKYVMMTSCAYDYSMARMALHGKLVPINSAGGIPLENTPTE